jgi:hypothetical protein
MNYADIRGVLQRMTPLVKTTLSGDKHRHILQRNRKTLEIMRLSRDSPGDNVVLEGLQGACRARIE